MFFFYFDRTNRLPAHRIDARAVMGRLMPYSPPDKSGFLEDDGRSLLVQCVHWNTANSRLEPAPLYHESSRTAAASWARLDNRDELGKKLDIDPETLAGYCDTELILFSYLKWQDACVDHLIGDFVFVIHDRPRQKIFCGRDHMGVRPLYYFVSDDLFVCATSPAALIGSAGVPVEPDEEWICEYLCGLSMSFERTSYRQLRKLPPAHCLTITPRQVQLRQYFQLGAEPELRLKDSREYVDAYREQLERAIACRLESGYALGAELSGGIDSSTITAYAAKILGSALPRLHTFAFAFSELEPQYIQAVIQACRLPHNHIFKERNKNHEETLQRSLDILGSPVEHGNATSHEPFYRLAEELDIRTLLSGFGGDEFCTTIHGYMVPLEMIMERRFRELFRILPGNGLFRFLRLVKMELRRRQTDNFKAPAYNPRFYEAWRLRWPDRIVRDEMARRYDLEERYFETARFDAGYTDLKRFTLEKRWQPFVPTRMENCALMAAARKIEYRWPLLDVRLVKLFLSIPPEENFYRGVGRYLHRRAIDGIVPGMVAWKQGKYMGPVNIDGDQNATGARVTLSDLHPEMNGYVDMGKLEQQLEDLSNARNNGMADNHKFQFTRNIQAVSSIDAWVKYVERESLVCSGMPLAKRRNTDMDHNITIIPVMEGQHA